MNKFPHYVPLFVRATMVLGRMRRFGTGMRDASSRGDEEKEVVSRGGGSPNLSSTADLGPVAAPAAVCQQIDGLVTANAAVDADKPAEPHAQVEVGGIVNSAAVASSWRLEACTHAPIFANDSPTVALASDETSSTSTLARSSPSSASTPGSSLARSSELDPVPTPTANTAAEPALPTASLTTAPPPPSHFTSTKLHPSHDPYQCRFPSPLLYSFTLTSNESLITIDLPSNAQLTHLRTRSRQPSTLQQLRYAIHDKIKRRSQRRLCRRTKEDLEYERKVWKAKRKIIKRYAKKQNIKLARKAKSNPGQNTRRITDSLLITALNRRTFRSFLAQLKEEQQQDVFWNWLQERSTE